jgi:hypothetical protein
MQVIVKASTVVIEVDATELASLDYSLGAFCQLANDPRSGIPDHYREADVERANQLEQQLFKAYCQLTERTENIPVCL